MCSSGVRWSPRGQPSPLRSGLPAGARASPTAWERPRRVYANLRVAGWGGAWMCGLRSRLRWGGEVGSMRWPWPWITTWWWNQHRVVRLSGSVRPLWDHGIMWWICRRYRDVQPEMVHRVASRCRMNRLRRDGMTRVRRPRARGCPSGVRAVTSTVPVHRIASTAFGPTLGPASSVTPVVTVRRCSFGGVDKHRQHR